MKWIVLITTLLVHTANVKAMTIKMDETQSFELNLAGENTLVVDKPGYYRGYVRSNRFINTLLAYSPNGELAKTLIGSKSKETEIFWLIEKVGNYQLKLDVASPESSKVQIKLSQIPLKDDQYVSAPSKITSPLIQRTKADLAEGKADSQSRFWQEISATGAPLVEYKQDGNAIITFLYRGEVNNVRLLGAPYGGHAQLSHIEGTDIWYRSFEVPDSTRLSYRLAPNVPQLSIDKNREQRKAVLATAQPDPLNIRPIFGPDSGLFGSASTLTLRKASSDRIAQEQGKPKGQITSFRFQSSTDLEPREITLYTPNSVYPVTKSSPLLILFDGEAYLNKVPTPRIMDNLIATKQVPPMRVLFINPPRPSLRAKELTPNKAFAQMMATELMPWLCTHHSVCPNAENTVLSGSSFGGLASMYIALEYPEHFGKVLSQSGSFWWQPKEAERTQLSWMAQLVNSKPTQNLSIYLNAGLFETEPQYASILQTNQQLFSTLTEKGYRAHFQSAASGHDYFSWRVMLADGLNVLFSD